MEHAAVHVHFGDWYLCCWSVCAHVCVCAPQGSWVYLICCCCGLASSCSTTPALRPLSSPASWFGCTFSSMAWLGPSSLSSSGCGEPKTSDKKQSGCFAFLVLVENFLHAFLFLFCFSFIRLLPHQQGLLPHVVTNWNSGAQPHHPALNLGRHLHAEGQFSCLRTAEAVF